MPVNAVSQAAIDKLVENEAIDEVVKYIDAMLDVSGQANRDLGFPVGDSNRGFLLRQFIFDGYLEVGTNISDYDVRGYDLIILDETDSYSVDTFNSAIKAFFTQTTESSGTDSDLETYRQNKGISASSTPAQIRQSFYNDFEQADVGSFSTFCSAVKRRLERLSSLPVGVDPNVEEPRLESEVNQLEEYINSLFPANYYGEIINRTFTNRNTPERLTSFGRAFSEINTTSLSLLNVSGDYSGISSLMGKLESSGLMALASYAYEIGEFAKKRFVNKARLQNAVYDPEGNSTVVNESADLPWLALLGGVIQNLKRDPIFFANVTFYFPSLTTFLLDAIATTGDYRERTSETAEQDADAFINSLERAFGVNEQGKAIFTMAFKASSTSDRINAIIGKSPYFRKNIAPMTPDTFHLRVGAANFYVPPVSIDVNSAFKTGSLTGGAIRQKNSPKFNAGYRETVVRMRLFFPNYEEIWGIQIDEGSSISVNEDYEIDFRNGGDSDKKVDKFLSSLRGLVAAFKYSPILPVKNHYLNSVHDITGVALSSMTISTIPNFPFALTVDIELMNFNHRPFLPMIKDFNQAVHWGKYRQYMGKAAGALHKYVNESFLIKLSEKKTGDVAENAQVAAQRPARVFDPIYDTGRSTDVNVPASEEQNDIFRFNIDREWNDGKHLILYVPAEAQTKIFLPDTSSFRTQQEKMLTDLGRGMWGSLLKTFGIDLNESAGYGVSLDGAINLSQANAYFKSDANLIKESIDLLIAGVNTDDNAQKIYESLATSFVQQNSNKLTEEQKDWLLDYSGDTAAYPDDSNSYNFNKLRLGLDGGISLNTIKSKLINIAREPVRFLDLVVDSKVQTIEAGGSAADREKVKDEITRAFNVTLYERFYKSGTIQELMESARERNGFIQFNEWEVPMIKVELDPNSVIINGVTVSLGNNFAKLQLQMQDEPTYQHIGGKDSYVNVSMTVIGEAELIKLKNIFDHISGLARLEHATGVIGFLGIKNIITALSGIKYVLPLNYRVSTIPNFPHAYSVELSLVDFDIFQQTREQLSSNQQKAMVDEFATKKNPFLRIKQMWGAFNSYPDFPLEVRDASNEVVGHLDPDFYFRSFEMFDRDVVNSIKDQTPRAQDFKFDRDFTEGDIGLIANLSNKLLEWLERYKTLPVRDPNSNSVNSNLQSLVNDIVDYFRSSNLSLERFLGIFHSLIDTPTQGFGSDIKNRLLTDFLDLGLITSEDDLYLSEVDAAPFTQGDISPNAFELRRSVEAMLSGEYSKPNDEFVSFDPDEVDFHKLIHMIPAADEADVANEQMPAVCVTALGMHYGYVERKTGRFYLTVNGANVKRDLEDTSYKLQSNLLEDSQSPDKGNTLPNTSVPGAKALSEYQNPYESGSIYAQLEKMMVDTSYRDISGRMLRAFPTYMLWLIDEGGYFAGAKLFDNFYGLQSVIDFSVVSSEDLLGDTLILRVSNMYSKLTSPESSKIFNPNIDSSQEPTLTDALGTIIERTLNISKNIQHHMKNEYVVDIASIRLKPGVRVHLRGGYGANPNSLQTLFNGIITNVEQGEIVTITAQSDAIELGAVINSSDKKGDSGKIDGGINTGLWLSEPRDLMVRLLTMGASRFREAISRANRGMVFSENRFGIRHFGAILYEPLTKGEQEKMDAIRENIAGAYAAVGGNDSFGKKTIDATSGFISNTRGNTIEAMSQLWANSSAEVDLEVFKRNIYPGNGTGIAQFLGGDIDDGWLTAASLTEGEKFNDKLEGNLGRLTDVAWNNLVAKAYDPNSDASNTLDAVTRSGQLIAEDRAGLVKTAFSIGAGAAAFAVGGPVAGVVVGGGLLGVLGGRGGTNIFRTMGLVSPNSDDDLPGYDEVSFRAQTYMRTVWDMFQACARLLPNYIVAVRPFEDRSTVFYGKPHWLYTSGVVPVTTGFPGEQRAVELGIKLPETRTYEEELVSILDSINRDSNPLADYGAFFQASEINDTFETVASDISNSSGIYAPTSALSGKIINFYSAPAANYLGANGNPIAKMPKSKGMVGVGLHLPVIPDGKKTSISRISLGGDFHKQLNNLPPRYRFPFFIATEDYVATDFPQIEIFKSGDQLDQLAEELHKENLSGIDQFNTYNNLARLTMLELIFFDDNQSVRLRPGTDELLLDSPINLNNLNTPAEQEYFVDYSIARMPFPNVSVNSSYDIVRQSDVSSEYAFEYQSEVYGKLTYEEWGAPSTVEDEQFYIAMRWPYLPPNETIREAFKNHYELGELVGTAEDYKKRKVLVYNPSNGRAVVCRPAYFMWGEADQTDAIVSPDAAYFLGIITQNPGEDSMTREDRNIGWGSLLGDHSKTIELEASGFRITPVNQECLMAFVPDNIPVGVISTPTVPITKFNLYDPSAEPVAPAPPGLGPNPGTSDQQATREQEQEEIDSTFYAIGFGAQVGTENLGLAVRATSTSRAGSNPNSADSRNPLTWYSPYGSPFDDNITNYKYGGNPLRVGEAGKTYFEAALAGEYDTLNRENLYGVLEKEREGAEENMSGLRKSFLPVWSPVDQIGIAARAYYDENFDGAVNVIAGDGRTLRDADNIWNEFRYLYHTYNSVKAIFRETFGLDPDSDEKFPPHLLPIVTGQSQSDPIEKFSASGNTAEDEFAILLGSDYAASLAVPAGYTRPNRGTAEGYREALEFARTNWIDAPASEGGLVEYFNNVITKQLQAIYQNFLSPDVMSTVIPPDALEAAQPSPDQDLDITPRKLFYLMVGIFRQKLWSDPYARAWLVLKPDRKRGLGGAGGGDDIDGYWSFKPVDKIFREFINPYNDLAKKNDKFITLLSATKSEGNSSTDIIVDAVDGISNFFETNIGPIWRAVSDGLSGLLGMFKLNMQQMGYALSEVGNFSKQANILNKALNDSIYYSLGRPGTLLRAVDNPFTREYGEPVIEVREPFQRLHYLSSFSHILSNQIQENLNNVATVVTAVSDGKYPVTVALDKAAPAERQVEKTVETGIYFDNMVGEGFFSVLHPLMHPFETARGVAKNIQGTPDELSARRIALSHLKESIKDIYGGELLIIGNGDIRPHDLVYLADIYERMYGIFEVEQVIHHFTPDMGFVTAITPNALVTVNDPSRWFISSWIDSWMNVQTIRNDTRMYLGNIKSGNSPLSIGGDISMEALGEALSAQITGGLQYTHGSTALVKDLMANQTAQTLSSSSQEYLANAASEDKNKGLSGFNVIAGAIATAVPIVGQLAWKGWKWVRDNLLDQHGCYVQYLNKNGQPMDAGLSYNQGMVVGKYHSKALLPGILGVRSKVRTVDGYAYVRSDDIFKNMGWQEKEINDLVRYISYENALVHARVLKLAGLGPERADLEQMFKIICKVTKVVDGDTIIVQDIFSSSNNTFTIRFDGINTAELNDVRGTFEYSDPVEDDQAISIIDVSTPSGMAKVFVQQALKDKLFVVRVNPNRSAQITPVDNAYDPGAPDNVVQNYQVDQFSRVIGTIFYYLPQDNINKMKANIERIVRTDLTKRSYSDEYGFNSSPFVVINSLTVDEFKEAVKLNFDSSSPFYTKFDQIYNALDDTVTEDYFVFDDPNDLLTQLPLGTRRAYTVLVSMLALEFIYERSSEWPTVAWDEYYDDGRAVSLNWELVTNNLARVYVSNIQTESDSLQSANDSVPYEAR